MGEPLFRRPQYWLISFSMDAAHMVVTPSRDHIPDKVERTYHVLYQDLRFRYIDLESEARMEAVTRKTAPNPRIILNSSVPIEQLLELPECRHNNQNEEDMDFFKSSVEMDRKASDELKSSWIARWDRDSKLTQEELFQEILAQYSKKKDYVPFAMRNLGQAEYLLGLPQAGFLTGMAGFATMEIALDVLYERWSWIRENDGNFREMNNLEQLVACSSRLRR